MTTIVSIDAECNGLAGRAFCVAASWSNRETELDLVVYRCPINGTPDPWVVDNVLPALVDVPQTHDTYEEMLDDLRAVIDTWGGKQTPMLGHVIWPVEARLLLDMYPAERIWRGPYPLLDVASILHARGYEPTSVDSYLTTHGIPVPSGSPHHPLYDARAAERCSRHLMPPPPLTQEGLTR